MTDSQNIVHSYTPMGILLISRYSDTAAVIKHEGDIYIQYNGDDYSKRTPVSISTIADLFDTCGHILVFYRQV